MPSSSSCIVEWTTPLQSEFLVFLRTLSLLGLESLSISWNAAQGPLWSKSSSDTFIEFLEELRSLETLHLGYLPFDTRQILDCLRVVSSLRSLSISVSRGNKQRDFINNEFLGALTQEPGRSDGFIPFLQRIRLASHGESFTDVAWLCFVASRWRYQESPSAGHLDCLDIVSPKQHAEYRPRRFKDLKEGRLEVSAGLKSDSSMVQVLSSFPNSSYGRMICFMNGGEGGSLSSADAHPREFAMEAIGYTVGERTPQDLHDMKASAVAWCTDKQNFIKMQSGSKFITTVVTDFPPRVAN
ncbi:hypothetical protein B0H14DRAFT_2584626 [Mycena olivaceomarginata]|nr:hypothetical protein B0H14DRAFT_2584626 [Mycena olivaceomarginata]